MENELETNTEQVVDLEAELGAIHKALLVLESRIDEIESRVNALGALMQVHAKDGQTICEGFEKLSKIVEGHHVLLKNLIMARQGRKPSTLQ